MGRSFGGLIATNMINSIVGKSMFSGVSLLTPYYHLWTEKLYRLYPYVKMATYVKPNHILPSEFQAESEEYMEKWHEIFEDPRSIYYFTLKMATVWVEEQRKAKEAITEISTPMLFIEAEKDNTVSNPHIREYYNMAKYPTRNKYAVIKDCDHSLPVYDPVFGSQVIRHTVSFFDKLVAKHR